MNERFLRYRWRRNLHARYRRLGRCDYKEKLWERGDLPTAQGYQDNPRRPGKRRKD